MNTPDRTRLPNRPNASERPVFRYQQPVSNNLPPGPGRRFDRRHWARSESSGWILMLSIVAVGVFWVGVDIGLFPDVFRWYRSN
jgi:hypothetical protein